MPPLRSYNALRSRRSLIECPRCGDTETSVVYRAAGIRPRGLREEASDTPQAAGRVESFLRAHFEDVGERFAEEARKLHFGEGEPRNIRGATTPDEERELREEGVPFIKIAVPKPPH